MNCTTKVLQNTPIRLSGVVVRYVPNVVIYNVCISWVGFMSIQLFCDYDVVYSNNAKVCNLTQTN